MPRTLAAVVLFLSAILFSAHHAQASGCFNDQTVYDTAAIAQAHGESYCYFEKLEQIANPQTMADRQYNFFARKLNEYVTIFGVEQITKAQFEFAFYPDIRGSALSRDDARQIKFAYTQKFSCGAKKAEVKIEVEGITGLTGVCLSRGQ